MAIGINWKAFGPGILIASAAIGGSHLIASTQAGRYMVGNLPSSFYWQTFLNTLFFALPPTTLMKRVRVSLQATPKSLNFIFGHFSLYP